MRITQSIDLKKKDGFLFINAILLMGFFIFRYRISVCNRDISHGIR